jgi:hypothetical protein
MKLKKRLMSENRKTKQTKKQKNEKKERKILL